MDIAERVARALAEWDLGFAGNPTDDLIRYGTALPERRALVEQLWRGRLEEAEYVLRAIGRSLSDAN